MDWLGGGVFPEEQQPGIDEVSHHREEADVRRHVFIHPKECALIALVMSCKLVETTHAEGTGEQNPEHDTVVRLEEIDDRCKSEGLSRFLDLGLFLIMRFGW